MRPVLLLLLAASAASAPAFAAPRRPFLAAVPEPVLFFAEDWEGESGGFPAARAARAAFLAYLEGAAEEDFERRSGRVLELPLGGYGARLIGGARDSVSAALTLAPGRRATSARRYYEHGSARLMIELERGAQAVGFYAIDVGDAGGRLRVTVRAEDGWERSFSVPHRVVPRGDGRGEGAVLFFGVVAPEREIRRVELANVGDPGDGFGYDDLVVGRLRRPVL